MGWKRAALTVGAVLAAGSAIAQQAPTAAPPRPEPYLGDRAPDTYRILPPAPVPGTTRYEADRTVFLATRSLEGSPRWALAQSDADLRTVLPAMSCAAGVSLSPEATPRFARLIGRVGRDSSRAVNHPKDIYKRQRPYLIDEGHTCIEKTPSLAASPDYPSGHSTFAWTTGLILAELVPDRATEILVRARAFGESRMVCGVHNMSAVEAGRTNGSILVAGLHGDPQFRKDLEAARAELAKARKAGPAPDPAACAKDAELLKSPL
jgi:acid phosphatase (class A)